WQKLRAQAIGSIDATHKEFPERAGTDLVEVRAALRIQEPEVLESLVAHLCEGDFVRNGSVIARTSHRPTLPVHVQPVENRMRQALGSSRRVMVPLLERLDRDGVTRRVGDKRMLCRILNL